MSWTDFGDAKMNKILRTLLELGLVLTEPRRRDRMRARVADHIEDLSDSAAKNLGNAVDRAERLYHSVRGENHTTAHVLSFLAGIGCGIGAGLLLAPSSGDETREAIADKVHRFKDDVRDRFSSATGTE
jgi:hypothetical protein